MSLALHPEQGFPVVAKLVDRALVDVRERVTGRVEHEDGVECRVEDPLEAADVTEQAGVLDRRSGPGGEVLGELEIIPCEASGPTLPPTNVMTPRPLAAGDERDGEVRMKVQFVDDPSRSGSWIRSSIAGGISSTSSGLPVRITA